MERRASQIYPEASGPSSRTMWWIAAGIFCAVFLLYLPSLRSGFVYDAEAQILNDDYLHQGGHLGDVLSLRVLSQDVLDGTRPVHLLFLMMDARFWQRAPLGYHLTSQLLHASCAAGVFLLLMGVGEKVDGRYLAGAALGALVFACHPVNVEAVAEVSYREDLLATFFLLAGLGLATRFQRGGGVWDGAWVAGSVLAFFLAAGSKESGFIGPCLLVLYWILYRRGECRWKWLSFLIAVVLAVGAFAVARFMLPPKESQIFLVQPTPIGGSIFGVMEVQPRLWVFLLKNIIWPAHLSGDYVPQNVAWISLLVAWVVLIMVVAVQSVLAWRSRLACLGMAFFWLGLAPVSNFIPLYRPVADRFLYLPMAGVAVTLCAVIVLLPGRFSRVACGLIAVCLLPLCVMTVQRQEVFSSPLMLWKRTLEASPYSVTAIEGLGGALAAQGDYEEALKVYDRGLEITQGKRANLWAAVAITLEKVHRTYGAEQACERAIGLNPLYADIPALQRAMIMNREEIAAWRRVVARTGRRVPVEAAP